MLMSTKFKVHLSIAILLIAAIAILSLFSYCKGKKVGVAVQETKQVSGEVMKLEDEKDDVQKAVHTLDTDSLRVHILDLSRRVHEEAARIKK